MLSKIKSTPTETRSPLSRTSNASDNDDDDDEQQEVDSSNNDADSNNNNNNNNSNNNTNTSNPSSQPQSPSQQQQSKENQDELLDIVEVSRKRRLSKDSADSLTSFIRWSFSKLEPSIRRSLSALERAEAETNSKSDDEEKLAEDELLEEEEEWLQHQQLNNNNTRFQVPEQLMRQHARLSASQGAAGATNLALMKSERQLSGALEAARTSKRPRTQLYSPESKGLALTNNNNITTANNNNNNNNVPRKSSSYLGSVVERLHQQQQQQQQHQQQQHQQQQAQQQQQERDAQRGAFNEANSPGGLSFHLQQFLQGLDDNNQLVLAAAIHRALVSSGGAAANGPAGLAQLAQADSKSTASSTGSSSGGSSSITHSGAAPAANQLEQGGLHLADSLGRQRRAYNTRAALHGLSSSGAGGAARHQQSSAAAAAMMNISSRVQQQRHAQAAAALSALASAGSHHHSAASGLMGSSAAAAAAAAAAAQLSLGSTGAPMVDFECDTCGSSFDDRHRLMQHQSIHLELKKDWFTETPVDEVMKIFNRRRGEFLCNICNLRFEATLDYDQHNHQVHGPRPYCCQFCGNGTRTFKCWRQYLNHLYDHRYIFSCTIDDCDFTVNRRDSLRFHIFRFHLNCQLPQNQLQALRAGAGHNMSMIGNNNNNNNPDARWPSIEDEDEETENELNVAD